MRLRGFSLVEVMATIAMVGVLASIAVVAMSDVVESARLRTDADAVEDVLRRARNLARLERRCVQTIVTPTRLTTTPIDHGTSPPPPDCSGGSLLSDRRVVLNMPRGLRLSDARFLFDRSGGVLIGDATPRDGGGIDIVATITDNRGVRTFRVSVLAGSGAIVRRQ